jgi:hypothetical protein
MFKPLARSNKTPQRQNGGFAETQFLHTAGEDDYSGFAPTQMFGEDGLVPLGDPASPADPAAAHAAASASRSTLERVAAAPVAMAAAAPAVEESPAQAWATSQWVAAQEARAHDAAAQARAVIAAQRRADEQAAAHPIVAAASAPRTGLARLRAAFERLLPGGLLPLFIGVSVTMALISTALPLIDRP